MNAVAINVGSEAASLPLKKWLVFTGLLISLTGAAIAQEYPVKPVRIVTSGVGGGGDFTARQISQGISGPLGQQVVVENRPAGVLASEAVSRAAPDGYTLLVNGASFWIVPLMQKVPYEVSDLAPVSLLERGILVVVVHPSLPVKSVRELIALAKAKPGELNYAGGTSGGPTHLASELFKSMTATNIVGVPYKGTGPAVTALLSGEVQLSLLDAVLVGPHVKQGKMRAIAATSSEPSTLAPGLPTVAASGVPGFEWVSSTGLWAPAKTPPAIIARLNQEVVRVLNRPEVKDRFLNGGVEVVASTPEQFAAVIKSETVRTGKIIRDANIKVQ